MDEAERSAGGCNKVNVDQIQGGDRGFYFRGVEDMQDLEYGGRLVFAKRYTKRLVLDEYTSVSEQFKRPLVHREP